MVCFDEEQDLLFLFLVICRNSDDDDDDDYDNYDGNDCNGFDVKDGAVIMMVTAMTMLVMMILVMMIAIVTFVTLPETNIAPENGYFENCSTIGFRLIFRGHVSCWECSIHYKYRSTSKIYKSSKAAQNPTLTQHHDRHEVGRDDLRPRSAPVRRKVRRRGMTWLLKFISLTI